MKKIRINKLPEGFEVVDGKVVKKMQDGGASTGDQSGYSLVTYPTNVTGQQMSDTEDVNVRYSLSSVPRDMANIEAEGGETVLTDLNNDGNFGLYDIKGPRHSKGGVPMFLPEQSFIFSDTKAMKMKGGDLKEFGINSRKSMTPAKISKNFKLNEYYGAMEDEYADDIQVNSAELMLKKNKMNLSKLAFGQELNKQFEDGVPLASHPYLVSIGEDPIEFTARIENINKEKAMLKTLAALPPEKQAQILALQEFMAQAQGMQQAPQQMPQEGAMPPSADEQMMMAQQSIPGGPMSNGEMPMARFGTELRMYQKAGEITNDRQDTEFDYEGGSPEFIQYYQNDPDYRKRIYDTYKIEMNKVGKTPVPESEFHKVYLDAQRRNYELYNYAETYNKENNLQPGDEGFIDIKNEAFDRGYEYADTEGGKRVDHGVSPELKKLIESYNEANAGTEGFEPLTIPTKDETYTFQQGYRGSIYSEAAEQYKRKKEGKDYDQELLGSFFSTGAQDSDADKRVLNPYWKQGDPEDEKYFKGISKADSRYGNTTLGQRSRIQGTKTFRDPEPEPEPIEAPVPGDIGEQRMPPRADFWMQDLLKLNAINQRKRRLGLPYQPVVETQDIDYVLEDPTRAIAAINEQAALANVANNMFAGPQAGSARSASMAGKSMGAIADTVAGVQSRNVSTVNRGEYQQAMLDAQSARQQRDRNVKLYDDTERALQMYTDEKNFDREQYADALANAITNRANTFNLNTIQDYYQIDPMSGGMIGQVYSKAFDPVEQQDQMEQYFNLATRLKREGIEPTSDLLQMFMGQSTTFPNQTNINAEYSRASNNPYLSYANPMTQRSAYGKKGKEIKKYAIPFYTGKVGI
jgi:hypothetical protein